MVGENVRIATARGTGTNAFIQKNLSYINKKRHVYDYQKEQNRPTRKRREPNPEILEHEAKRQVECKCMHLQDELELRNGSLSAEQRLSAVEIEIEVKKLRSSLLEKLERDFCGSSVLPADSHVAREIHKRQTQRLATAFGISGDFKEGDSFKEIARH